MKKITFIALLLVGFVACDKSDDAASEPLENNRFHYDALSGNCLNINGEMGYNPFDLEKVRLTKNGECMKFPEMHLVFLLDTANTEDFVELGYNEINGFNFKGADLNSTNLYFNDLIDNDFRGTKMSNVDIGYARLNGRVDDFTEIPEDCLIANDTINCVL